MPIFSLLEVRHRGELGFRVSTTASPGSWVPGCRYKWAQTPHQTSSMRSHMICLFLVTSHCGHRFKPFLLSVCFSSVHLRRSPNVSFPACIITLIRHCYSKPHCHDEILERRRSRHWNRLALLCRSSHSPQPDLLSQASIPSQTGPLCDTLKRTARLGDRQFDISTLCVGKATFGCSMCYLSLLIQTESAERLLMLMSEAVRKSRAGWAEAASAVKN